MVEYLHMRQRREFWDRVKPQERYLREEKFRKRYRLDMDTVIELAAEFGASGFSTQGMKSGGGLSHEERFCLALRFLSTGDHHTTVGDTQGLHRSTVSRAVTAVCTFLTGLRGRYVRFPKAHEYDRFSIPWHTQYTLPGILGAVDGSQIGIKCPDRTDNSYFCRKGYHSINVMAICNMDGRFLYASCRFPGSVHDQVVWESSNIGQLACRGGLGDYSLLGDSGYGLRKYMLTPFRAPATEAEEAYNRAHKQARNAIERAFGVLKQRFRCIDRTSGYMQMTPEKASLVIMACIVLHNISLERNIPLDIDENALHIHLRDIEQGGVEMAHENGNRHAVLEGMARRADIVATRFS